MLNRLRDKRGAVMESALLFLLVVFLLCFLLTLVALGGHANTKLAEAKLENRLALEQIAQDFIAYAPMAEDPKMFATGHGAYTAKVTPAVDESGAEIANTYTLTVTLTPTAEAPTPPVLLTVQVRLTEIDGVKTATILAYRYGAMTVTP